MRGRYTRQPRRSASARSGRESTSEPRDTYRATALPGLSHGLRARAARMSPPAARRCAGDWASRRRHSSRRAAARAAPGLLTGWLTEVARRGERSVTRNAGANRCSRPEQQVGLPAAGKAFCSRQTCTMLPARSGPGVSQLRVERYLKPACRTPQATRFRLYTKDRAAAPSATQFRHVRAAP